MSGCFFLNTVYNGSPKGNHPLLTPFLFVSSNTFIEWRSIALIKLLHPITWIHCLRFAQSSMHCTIFLSSVLRYVSTAILTRAAVRALVRLARLARLLVFSIILSYANKVMTMMMIDTFSEFTGSRSIHSNCKNFMVVCVKCNSINHKNAEPLTSSTKTWKQLLVLHLSASVQVSILNRLLYFFYFTFYFYQTIELNWIESRLFRWIGMLWH